MGLFMKMGTYLKDGGDYMYTLLLRKLAKRVLDSFGHCSDDGPSFGHCG